MSAPNSPPVLPSGAQPSLVDIGGHTEELGALILFSQTPIMLRGFYINERGRMTPPGDAGGKLVTYTISNTARTFAEMDIAAYAVSPSNSLSPDGVNSGIPSDAIGLRAVAYIGTVTYTTDGFTASGNRVNPDANSPVYGNEMRFSRG